MRCLKNNSIEYKIASEEYEKLWRRRDEIEEKIVGLCNKNDDVELETLFSRCFAFLQHVR